ncbi:MAG: helix-turn-helix domain-containing protein [Methanomassiliicoccales archaeon]
MTDVLRLDLKGIDEEYRKISGMLRKIGMSEYEAKAYVGLIVQQHATADEVASIAEIPRTSAYKALQSLREKGFVDMSEGRPAMFHSLPTEEIKGRIVEDIKDAFNKLESVRGMLSEKGIPQLVFTISGRERVLSKIGEILEASRRRFLISTSQMQAVRVAHSQRFKDAVKRGVEVLVVAEPFVKVPACTKVYRKTDLIATDVIGDGEMALIASPDLSVCGFSDNLFLTGHLEGFMMTVLEKTDK